MEQEKTLLCDQFSVLYRRLVIYFYNMLYIKIETIEKIRRINKIKIIIFFIVVLLYFLYDYIRMFLKNERVFYGK